MTLKSASRQLLKIGPAKGRIRHVWCGVRWSISRQPSATGSLQKGAVLCAIAGVLCYCSTGSETLTKPLAPCELLRNWARGCQPLSLLQFSPRGRSPGVSFCITAGRCGPAIGIVNPASQVADLATAVVAK